MPKKRFRQKDIASLVEKYGLAKKFRGQTLFQRLHGTADIYFRYKERSDRTKPNQDVREQLDATIKTIDRLERQRRNLSESADLAFHRAVSGFEIEADYAALKAEPIPNNPIQKIALRRNLSFYRIDLGEDAHTNIFFNENLIGEGLLSLRTYLETARDDLRKRQPGRHRSESLRMGVINIASIWCDYRKEPFRVTYVKGEPKSEAARFCVDAMKLIDHSIPKSRIVTAMRSYASEARKRKSQEMGSKKS